MSNDALLANPCNTGFLRQVTAEASEIQNPVPLYPVFFLKERCGDAQFPDPIKSINCRAGTNCMAITPVGIYKESAVVAAKYVNKFTTMFDPYQYANSFYVPENYKIHFFVQDPSLTKPSSIVRFTAMQNQLYTNLQARNLILSDGSTPFYSGITPRITHYVVEKVESFTELLLDMCLYNRQITLGSAMNPLNPAWTSKTKGCDNLVKSLCTYADSASVYGGKYKKICNCKHQKQQLDTEFGVKNDVPVCCFGKGTDGKLDCAFDPDAYKSAETIRGCCSFAACQSLVENPVNNLKQKTSTPGIIHCDGKDVQFPPKPKPSEAAKVIPGSTTTKKEIPKWTWYVVGATIVFLIVFIILLSLVLPKKKTNTVSPQTSNTFATPPSQTFV